MPPYFPYILALFAYIAFAACVLLVAALLAIPHQTRSFAKRLAASMIGSFPGVFLFQMLAFPFVLVVLLMLFVTYAVFHPSDGWQGFIIVGFGLLMFCIFGVASLVGFYAGWRVAWEFAAGRSIRDFLGADRLLGPFVRLARRRLPLVGKFL
jgi:hypothetical protein